MKVTFVLPGRGFSGGIRVSVRMAAELSKMGHDVRVLYRENHLNIKSIVSYIYKKFLIRAPGDWISQFDGSCSAFIKLTAELVGNMDIVMSVGPDCVEEMMKLPNDCGYKIFNVHGLTLRNPSLGKTAWHTNVPKIVVSNYVRQEMLKADVNNIIAVVPNGIDTSEYFPDSDGDERTGVGTVYGPGVAKDPDTIVAVFAHLHELRPEIPLICFGSSPRPKKLIRAVQYYRLPTLEEARRLYSRCLVWFSGSSSEGFNLPVLEAMACGCAVVCTDCGGPNDYLKSGSNGIVVEKESPYKMVNEILKIIDDQPRRIRLVNDALKTVKTLSWPDVASKMEAAMLTLISGRWR